MLGMFNSGCSDVSTAIVNLGFDREQKRREDHVVAGVNICISLGAELFGYRFSDSAGGSIRGQNTE